MHRCYGPRWPSPSASGVPSGSCSALSGKVGPSTTTTNTAAIASFATSSGGALHHSVRQRRCEQYKVEALLVFALVPERSQLHGWDVKQVMSPGLSTALESVHKAAKRKNWGRGPCCKGRCVRCWSWPKSAWYGEQARSVSLTIDQTCQPLALPVSAGCAGSLQLLSTQSPDSASARPGEKFTVLQR